MIRNWLDFFCFKQEFLDACSDELSASEKAKKFIDMLHAEDAWLGQQVVASGADDSVDNSERCVLAILDRDGSER